MALVHVEWNPGPRVYRTFAISLLVTGAIVSGLGGWTFDHVTVSSAVAGGLAILGLLVLTGPEVLRRPIYLLITGPAWVMGNVVTRVILTLFFYGIVTPMGLVARLAGRDVLGTRKPASSYYHPVDADQQRGDYERPF
jgi:hypothetical protein